MDPEACWDRFVSCLEEDDLWGACEALEDLQEWGRRGGFWPANALPGKAVVALLRQLTVAKEAWEAACHA